MTWLDQLPMPVVVVMIVALLGGATVAGYLIGDRARQRDPDVAAKRSEMSGAALGSMLTLTGFLLAFAVSSAGSNFNDRRALVITEANAIGTAYDGTTLLADPHGNELRSLLVDYTDLRARIDDFEGDERRFDDFVEQSEAFHALMLIERDAAAELDPTPVVTSVINALGSVIDVHNLRTDLRFNRTPPLVFVGLVMLSGMALFAGGYVRGLAGRTTVVATSLLVATYVIVFAMLIDLDRHQQGIFSVNQQPMLELLDDIVED